MDYRSRCMKISTPINNPAPTNNGGKRPFNSRRPLSTSERDSIVGAPHLRRPHDQYSIINGGELPGTQTQWIPLKGGSNHDWLTRNRFWRTSGIVHPRHGRREE